MNARTVLATALLCLSAEAAAQTALSPEQRAEVQRMIDGGRGNAGAGENAAATLTPGQRAEIQRMIDAGRLGAPAGSTAATKVNGGWQASAATNVSLALREEAMLPKSGVAEAPLKREFAGIPAGRREMEFDIEFDKDNAVAAFDWVQSGQVEGGADRAILATSNIRISAPIDDEENGFASFATLNALSSGFSVKLGRSWRVTDVGFLFGLNRDPKFRELCRRSGQDPESSCDSEKIYVAAESDGALRTDLTDYARANYGWMQEYTIGIQGARATFDYIAPDLSSASVDRNGWGMTVAAAFHAPGRNQLFAVGADLQRLHKAGDTIIRCPPSNSVGPVTCVSGADGPPSRVTRKLLWGEARGAVGPVAYSLRLTRDLELDETGVDLPIYFFRNAEGKLSGGVRLGWTSEQDFGAGIFISAPLD
jgi:hypothetical protein